MSSSDPIHILVTGGKMAKTYDIIQERFVYTKSQIADILKKVYSLADVRISTLMLKDSLKITEDDREEIVLACLKSPYERIVVVHGTHTLPVTAAEIAKVIKNKTVIVTGCVVPAQVESATDSHFNLGMALGAAQMALTGVYVTMNGQIFPWDNVQMDTEKGVFDFIRLP